jgi:hypothetical protein
MYQLGRYRSFRTFRFLLFVLVMPFSIPHCPLLTYPLLSNVTRLIPQYPRPSRPAHRAILAITTHPPLAPLPSLRDCGHASDFRPPSNPQTGGLPAWATIRERPRCVGLQIDARTGARLCPCPPTTRQDTNRVVTFQQCFRAFVDQITLCRSSMANPWEMRTLPITIPKLYAKCVSLHTFMRRTCWLLQRRSPHLSLITHSCPSRHSFRQRCPG